MSLLIVWPHRPRRSDKLSARKLECIDDCGPGLCSQKANAVREQNGASITQEPTTATSRWLFV
jgi:hypothetical protein